MVEAMKMQGNLKVNEAVDPTRFKKDQRDQMKKIWQDKKMYIFVSDLTFEGFRRCASSQFRIALFVFSTTVH
ncbi:Hypothetical predicted protein [Octopus vulgaris]|uniref:Uncharacterized protein n=1 Tax=Octopus vulgaris TaxID=6645 RepID=A0AA36AIG7_OCTVU|nr:Hypothetical predicted protein [Octopus vulgaris]